MLTQRIAARLRAEVLGAGVVLLNIGAILFTTTATCAKLLVALISRLTRYDGCHCADCELGFLGVSRHSPGLGQFWVPACGYLDTEWAGPALIFFGAGLVALGRMLPRLLRRFIDGRCPTCGYSTAGLPPESPCPECGGRLDATPAADA